MLLHSPQLQPLVKLQIAVRTFRKLVQVPMNKILILDPILSQLNPIKINTLNFL